MLGFFLRIILAVIAVRFLAAVVRAVIGGPPRANLPGSGTPGGEASPKPLVDRASAIDVPFTEERTEP